MDSISQAALGASIGQVILGKKLGLKGAVIGAIVATIPDLDILLLPFYDSIQGISIHRGYSHSIVFSLIGALLLSLLLSRYKWTKAIPLSQLLLFNWIALFTHMLLDSFTAYGTQLFLPFSDQRISFDSINIVDPIYTIPLLLGLGISIYQQLKDKKQGNSNLTGLVVSSFYLLFTLGHKQHISDGVKAELKEQKIEFNEMRTIPVGVGNLNWYGVAKSADSLYLGKYSDIKHNHIKFHSFPINDNLLHKVDNDLSDKLKWFSQGFYTVAESKGTIRLYNLQCDMQGVRSYGDYKAPTSFYFELTPQSNGSYILTTGMHNEKE